MESSSTRLRCGARSMLAPTWAGWRRSLPLLRACAHQRWLCFAFQSRLSMPATHAAKSNAGCVCLYATHRNGGSLSADLHLHPSLSVSVGRQPYTDETEGSLLVRLSADAFPAAPTLTPAATLLVGGRQHALVLKGPKLQRGKTTVLTFSLAELPPTVGLLVGGEAENGNNTGSAATVTFEISGIATATPLPFVRLGDSRSSQSVLDYATGAVLTGPERVPLLPNGFDSHFSTASGADFDEVSKKTVHSFHFSC